MPSYAHAATGYCKHHSFCHQSRTPMRCSKTTPCLSSSRVVVLEHPATSTDGLKSHSPPRPPQTRAAQFKRPYRNCPDRTTCAPPHSFFRGSPDRALTFISIDPGKLPRSRLLESQPTNACALANKAAQYHAKAQLMGMFPNHSFSVYQSTRSCRSRTSSGQAARPTRPRLCQRPTVLK